MLFGPITDKERLVWQRQAVKVLADVIGEALRAGLPFVHWQLGHGRTLIAQCLNGEDEQRRNAFSAWTQFLGVSEVKEDVSHGIRHLRGSVNDFRGCRVLVTANLYSDGEEARS